MRILPAGIYGLCARPKRFIRIGIFSSMKHRSAWVPCQAQHSLSSKASGGHRNKNRNASRFFSFLKVLRVFGSFNIYYANFYEKNGFRRALEDDLTSTRENRLFLYVAAHGTAKRIGGLTTRTGMKLPAMFKAVNNAANYSNIEGVLIGSCSAGNTIGDFISTTKNSRIAWIFGYTCGIGGMASTLIDVSIFEHLMKLKKSDLRNRKKILDAFIMGSRDLTGIMPSAGRRERTFP